MKPRGAYKVDAFMLYVMSSVFLLFYHILLLGIHLMIQAQAVKERLMKHEENKRRRISELVADKKKHLTAEKMAEHA